MSSALPHVVRTDTLTPSISLWRSCFIQFSASAFDTYTGGAASSNHPMCSDQSKRLHTSCFGDYNMKLAGNEADSEVLGWRFHLIL